MARQADRDHRPPHRALERARAAAFLPGQYVGQESFVCADEIRRLARQAGIARHTSVLDVCCGTAGPGRLITTESHCAYLGVDHSAPSLDVARELAADLPCRFEQTHVPPLPAGRFEVVLLIETLLAFADKGVLLQDVARALAPGGRFACTVEAGAPLTAAERAAMPAADTVWPIELPRLTDLLHEAGLSVIWQEQWTGSHQAAAAALLRAYRAESAAITEAIGPRATADLIAAHELWRDWLGSGRIAKVALVAEKIPTA